MVSVRTVEHHVSAILAKLCVSTRRDAAARAAGFEGGPFLPSHPASGSLFADGVNIHLCRVVP
jgi:hypothetical protein